MPSNKLKIFYIFGIKILIFLIPFIPLYFSPSILVPHITGKNFAFRILVELAAVLWLGLIVLSKEYRPKNSTMLLPILTFTFIVGLADLLGVNPYNSFWSNYERMEGYLTILHLALYFMIIRSILKTKNDWMIFLSIFLVASVCVSSYALFQKFVEGFAHRALSTLGNPPFLASYLLLTVFVGLILTFNTQKLFLRYIYLLSVALNVLVIYFTATRGAILAILIGVISFSLFFLLGKSNTPKDNLYKKAALSVFGVIIILSIVFWTFRNTDFIRQNRTFSRFVTMSLDTSVTSRLDAWKVAWNGAKERPILGWGQENFISVYTINPIPYGEKTWMDRAHNIVLDWLVNAGFLGLFSYLAIFVSAFYIIWITFHKNIITKTEAVTIITALVAYFIQNLFIFDTINTYLVFFTLLAYIDNLGYPERALYSEVNVDSRKLKIKSASITVLALLIFSATSYFINYKPMRESQLTTRIILSLQEYKSFLPLLDDFNKALSYKTFGDTDVRLLMNDVSNEILRLKTFTLEGALQFVQATAEELEKLVAAHRYDLRYWGFLIDIYNAIAVYEPSFVDKAEVLIKEYMRLNPENQWIYFALADNFILKKDYENAFITVKNAVDMDPQNDAMQLKLALAGILTLKENVLNSALGNVRKIRMSKDDDIASGRKPVFSVDELLVLAQISMEIKNFHQALQFYKEIIAVSPEEAKYHFDAAKIYLTLGDKVNALKEAKKALELDPENFTEEVAKIINSKGEKY